MHFYIITGASRGLGAAIAKKLLAENSQIYCLSRTSNRHLIRLAEETGSRLSYVPCDLNDTMRANEILQHILEEIPWEDIESITLVNNAGRIDPIRPIERCDEKDIIRTFNVNLLAPVILTSSFVRSLSHLDAEKTIINISSTASKKTYDGLSCYISSKAALSQFTRCIEEEQKGPVNPVKIVLFEPGSMDTGMQEKIAHAGDNLSSVLRFRRMRKEGFRDSVDQVAEKVISLIRGYSALAGGKISRFAMTLLIYMQAIEDEICPIIALT